MSKKNIPSASCYSELVSESSSFPKSNKPNSKAFGFTLVELVVVITILAILGIIGFISIGGYSLSARDSSRISDMTNIKKTLELTAIKTSSYPIPTNGSGVTFSGGLVWTQGSVGDSVVSFVNSAGFKLSRKPMDPKYTNIEYTYSLLNNGKEYQVATIMEDSNTVHNSLITPVYAAINPLTAYIGGNYNGLIAKVQTGSTTYYLTLPSIISQDLSNIDYRELTNATTQSGNLVLHKKGNIPNSYTNNGITPASPSINFDALSHSDQLTNGSGIVAYSTTDTLDSTGAMTMMNNIYSIYNRSNLNGDTTAAPQVNSLIAGGSGGTILMSAYNGNLGKSIGGSSLNSSSITYASCAFSGETIPHGQNITAYTGTTITWNATYDCSNISQVRTCNNGTLSGDSTYQYTSCVKGIVNNCSASGSFLKNGHSYSIPALNHSSGATNISSTNILQNHGTFRYTLSNIECNDGNYINVNESATPSIVSCDSGYHTEDNLTCISNTQLASCTGNPSNTVWNTVSSITQTWNGSSWSPTIAATYNVTASTTSCNYKCATNYTWNGSSCVPATQTFTCAAKPATGTVWNTASSYTQTWNGSTWLPVNSTTMYNKTASTTSCNYKCATNYTWNGSSCVGSFTYPLPSGTLVTVTVTGPGYGTVSGTKTLHTPACNTDDIAIWQDGITNLQVWAACNVGASVAVVYPETVVSGNVTPDATEVSRMGYLYQWGNNADVTSAGTAGQTTCTNTANATNSAIFRIGFADWCSTVNTNNRWGETNNTSVARKGPCPTGYHIPTAGTLDNSTEWGIAYSTANSTEGVGTCNQASTYNRLQCALMLPLAGMRNGSTATPVFNSQGLYGWYWSSSTSGTSSISMYLMTTSTSLFSSGNRANALSVRCLKN